MKKNLNIAYLNGAGIGKKVINVTETINNQDKYIEITENGSVEVVADSGYTGLGKVTVNVEVASSGGGSLGDGESGGEGDFSTPIYYETLISADNAIIDLLVYPALIKTNIDGFTEFITSVQMFSFAQKNINIMQNIEAICFLPFRAGKIPTISLEDELGDNFSIFFKRRITKEEFYAV